MITVERLREVLRYDPDTGKFYWRARNTQPFDGRFAGREALTADNGQGYKCGMVDQKPVKAHRVAFAMMAGKWPDNIDHIDGSRSNNKWANLRHATKKENSENQKLRSTNTSGQLGVFYRKDIDKWAAQIGGKSSGGKQHLGMFNTKEEAVAARKGAEIVLGYHPNHGRTK